MNGKGKTKNICKNLEKLVIDLNPINPIHTYEMHINEKLIEIIPQNKEKDPLIQNFSNN